MSKSKHTFCSGFVNILAFHKIPEITRSWLFAYFPHDPFSTPVADEPRVKEEGWRRGPPCPRWERPGLTTHRDACAPGPGRGQVWEGPRQPSRAAWILPQTRLPEYTEHGRMLRSCRKKWTFDGGCRMDGPWKRGEWNKPDTEGQNYRRLPP